MRTSSATLLFAVKFLKIVGLLRAYEWEIEVKRDNQKHYQGITEKQIVWQAWIFS